MKCTILLSSSSKLVHHMKPALNVRNQYVLMVHRTVKATTNLLTKLLYKSQNADKNTGCNFKRSARGMRCAKMSQHFLQEMIQLTAFPEYSLGI